MYLNALDVVGQPKREPSREELSELLLLCRRDALLAERASGTCEQALAFTEQTSQDAMRDLAECRKRLVAAEAALRAAQKRARGARHSRRKGTRSSRP